MVAVGHGSIAGSRPVRRVAAIPENAATAGLLISLVMLLENQEGFDYTGADCCGWMREVGFSEAYVEQPTGIELMVVGIK